APFWVALRLRMAEGWHTYWRNPGDSGLPTTIEWTLPEGFEASEIVWPHPERLPFGPLVNYGYEGQVGLLTRITPPDGLATGGSPVTLAARADWLVCAEVCIPEGADLALTLPVTPGEPPVDGRWAEDFAAARRAVPLPSPWPATFAASEDALALAVAAPDLDAGRIVDVWFFPLEPRLIDHAAPQAVDVGARGLTLRTARGAARAPVGEGVEGVLVIGERLDGGTVTQAFAVSALPGAVPAAVAASPAFAPGIGLLQAVLFALLGGVILNLMPCVFPVLSVKALALVRHAGSGDGAVRRHGLAYAAGVLACFGLIAGALIALKAGGAAVGWGFQLQSPVVIALLAYLMFALGLSLSGAFSVGGGLMGAGGGLAARGGYAGSFFTGALAAVVATPCTAPFMGAALGFAIVQPWYVALGVFLALGLGMALPYLALCFSPGLLRLLPRPGPWMERFKQLLAFPLYATAVWLVWVLSLQAGPEGVAAALAGMVLIAFAAWLYQATRESAGLWRPAGALGAIAAVVLALGLVGLPDGPAGPVAVRPAAAEGGPAWEPFSPTRLAELRAEGRPVFVNMTAAWCITCLVNERVALGSPEIGAAFAEKRVAYLKGDWTNGDPAITAVLDSFGRTGVPLYVLYPPEGAAREPIVLPQLLTEARLKRELERL
ncbi:MAG TPA: protein-disulfide reductase DsbD domain-containing protein, partial [Geminicoccaceae bacterium]|nr:protein-disulfide reductase DsbD domain-containing protein [Geminicoccaceae bacterium]